MADLRLPWDTTVTATDASPSGWGICERFLPSDQVGAIGKWHERWRYRRLDPSEWQPRQRALSRCVFTDPLTVKGTLDFQDDCLQYKENVDFPEVDHSLLNPADWGTVGMGMWKHKEEHITMKEARCLLIAVRRLSRAQRHRRKRHLVLVDNLSLCFALGKGRAHNFGLLRVLEQIGSICLAATIVLRGRWIPSEKNIADGPSRGQILAGPFTKAVVEESKEAILSSLGGGISQPTEAQSQGFEVKGYERQCSHSSETSEKSFGVEGTSSELQAQEKENCGQLVGCSQRSRWKSSAEEGVIASGEKEHQCGGPGPVYEMYFRRFVDFCKDNGSPLPLSPEVLDAMLTDYMDLLFLDNRGAHEGEKTVAAVEFNIISVKGKLVRARRALRGWRKEMPPQSRLPLPKVAMFGIAMNLIAAGSREMALMVLVAFFLYLRPGEAADIKASSVVGPVRSAGLQFQFVRLVVREQEGGRPDKVGVYDNCIPFDLPSIQWIGRELLALAKTKKNKNSLVFAFTMEEFRKQFTKAAHHLNLQNLHPYQLRHGGATEDLSSRARDHASVKSRGRWHTDQSVRRYGKIGRVQQLLNKLSTKDLQFYRWSMKNMERVFQGSQVAKHSNL